MIDESGVSALIDRPLRVLTAAGKPATWRVIGDAFEARWQLSLVAPHGSRHVAIGNDLFNCLKQIRQQTRREGILLCCNGARRNTWPSGSLSSMAGAQSVYKMHRWRGPLPWDLVDIFDYAPPRTIATVEEQQAYCEKVHRYRQSALAWLNPILYITLAVRLLADLWLDARAQRQVAKADRARIRR